MGVHVGEAPLPVEGEEGVGDALQYLEDLRFAVPQRLLGLLPLRNVS
jgi:hypothetical protein